MDENMTVENEVIGEGQCRELTRVLEKYKAGKARTEKRILSSENWWKLRNDREERGKLATMGEDGYKSQSGWLHNVIVSKHADAMDAFPEPVILPREPEDKNEAKILSDIIPCVFEQNKFEDTYSDVAWQKLKTGTGVYKVVWDKTKLNGLGDISIERVNLLNIYWEPGIEDIQRSKYLFHTELADKELLEEVYPQLEGKLSGAGFLSTRFLYDDSVSTEGKVTIIECYYHKYVAGKKTLQYVKYVNDTVLYATENIPEMAERGLYDHGMYPYVFDTLFPIEGSPCGYGFVDLCMNPQTTIDLLNTSFVKNAMAGSVPRYFERQDGAVNEEEFLDLTKSIVHVNGNLADDSLRQIEFRPLDSVYVSFLDRTIQELRETSGNTETATGNTSSGVTAASAIAALQEASGKGSRDSNRNAYLAYSEIVSLSIELIRQFYDLPRQFRIIGNLGAQEFISYSNAGLQPQSQGNDFGVDMGYRLPVFDIKVAAQKKNVYSRVSQNELAIQFFQLGFFNPQMTDQALMCIEMMEFDGKEELTQKIARNGTMFQRLVQYMSLALQLAAKAAPEMVQGLSNDIMNTVGANGASGATLGTTLGTSAVTEPSHMVKAREQANNNAQVKQ